MRIEGTYTFLAPAEQVYAALLDPELLARIVPGCERLVQYGPVDADGSVTFEARVRGEGVSTIVTRVRGARRPAHLRLDLHAFTAHGAQRGQAVIDLVEQEGHTVSTYSAQVAEPGGAAPSRERDTIVEQAAHQLCVGLERALAAPGDVGGEEALLLSPTEHERALAPTLHSIGTSARLRAWGQRAGWMGAGLLLGMMGVAIVTSLARRLAERAEE